MIRVRISYRDVAECSEQFNDSPIGYEHAVRFLGVMDDLFSGQIVEAAIEWWCIEHAAWEHQDDSRCPHCGFFFCTDELEPTDREGRCCSDCRDDIRDLQDRECRCGSYCPDCTGIAGGPI